MRGTLQAKHREKTGKIALIYLGPGVKPPCQPPKQLFIHKSRKKTMRLKDKMFGTEDRLWVVVNVTSPHPTTRRAQGITQSIPRLGPKRSS